MDVVDESPDPELAAAVDDTMADALAGLGLLLRAAAAESPLLEHAPYPEDIIRKMRENGLHDPDRP